MDHLSQHLQEPFVFVQNKRKKGIFLQEKLVDGKWTKQFAFYPDEVGWEDLERIRQVIQSDPNSHFLKGILIARIFEGKLVSITENRLKITDSDGNVARVPFNAEKELLEAVEAYGTKSIVYEVKQFLKENPSIFKS